MSVTNIHLQRITYRLTMYGPEQVDSSSNMTYSVCISARMTTILTDFVVSLISYKQLPWK